MSFLTVFSACSDFETRQFTLSRKGTSLLNSNVTSFVPDFTLLEGKIQTIEASHLKLTVNDDSGLSGNIVITLLSAPGNGVLGRDGISLSVNDDFTLEDVENGLITYAHDGSESTADSFKFIFKNSADGSFTYGTVSIGVDPVDDPPETLALSPASFNEDAESTISLSYTDPESDIASTCSVSNLINVVVTTPCTCDEAGRCRVGVTGGMEYSGAASFEYVVTANGLTSDKSIAILDITFVYDPPKAIAIAPLSFDEDLETIITLSYSVVEDGDLATICDLSELNNVMVSESRPCACDASGECTVGVVGKPNYYGEASFEYTVTGGGGNSEAALATLTLNPVPDPSIATDMSIHLDEGKGKIVTLSYSDVDGDGDLATSCEIVASFGLNAHSCSCDSVGVCTVRVDHSGDYNSSFAGAEFYFNFTVSSGAEISPPARVSITVDPVNDAPRAYDMLPPSYRSASAGTPANIVKNTESVLSLYFTDPDSSSGGPWTCTLPQLNNVSVTTPCTCPAYPTCSVGITPDANYTGPASFDFMIGDNGLTSNVVTVYLKVAEPAAIVVKLFYQKQEDYSLPITLTEIQAPYDQPVSLGDWYLDHSSKQNITGNNGLISIEFSGNQTASITKIELPEWTSYFQVYGGKIGLQYPYAPYVSEIPLGEWSGTAKITYVVSGEEYSPRTFEFPVKASHSLPAPTHDEIKVNVYILASEGADGNPVSPVISQSDAVNRSRALIDYLNNRSTRQIGPSGDACTSTDFANGECEDEQLLKFELDKIEIVADDAYRSVNYTEGTGYGIINHFAQTHAEGGRLNFFIVNQITGGPAGFTSMGRKVGYGSKGTLAIIDKNYFGGVHTYKVAAHEAGHLMGMYHTAEDTKYMFGVRVPMNGIAYYEPSYRSYGPHCGYHYVNGSINWPVFPKYGGNAEYPAASNIMHGGVISAAASQSATFFGGAYFHSMGYIMKCWNQSSHGQGYPYSHPEPPI